jgi:3-hydroxybutyryl-CoA dehydrogenase
LGEGASVSEQGEIMTGVVTMEDIRSAAVIGAGTMGSGIAQVAAFHGFSTILVDLDQAMLDRGIQSISKSLDQLVKRGKIDPEEKRVVQDRISVTTSIKTLAGVDLVIEAVAERLDVKAKIFAELETIVSDSCIFASNTSSISITAIGSNLKLPARLAGLHFFNPAPVMKLVEVVAGLATDTQVVDTLVRLATSWGKIAVRAKSSPGFIVNRVARPFYGEGLRMLEEAQLGAEMIDAIMRACGGFKMGPLQLTDLIGQDINYSVTETVFKSYYQDHKFTPSLSQQELLNAGWLGRKSGRGFYDYSAETQPEPEFDHIRFGGHFQIQDVVESDLISSLVDRIRDHRIAIPKLSKGDEGVIRFSLGAELVITNGQTTIERNRGREIPGCVQMDYALDYRAADAVSISVHPELTEEAWIEVYAFFDFLGIRSRRIKDLPGLIVLRTVVMLINEACDALHHGVASAKDIDLAMRYGVNYPLGPFEWANRIGVRRVAECVERLNMFYPTGRYRLSPALRMQAEIDQPFEIE